MFADLLEAKLGGVLSVSPAQAEALERHYALLVRWNQRLNLTRVDSIEGAIERHYCEALFLASRLPSGPLRIADIGSGAGFPGFPVAVVRPDCEVTLIESHQRKSVFLREAGRGMANVRVLSQRAEEVPGEFDLAISRAVSYSDLKGVLKRLARSADLLTGAEDPPGALGFVWAEPVLLPWGDQRFLRHGTHL